MKRLSFLLSISLTIFSGSNALAAKDVKKTFEATCKACHQNPAFKALNSPQFGDKAMWQTRIEATGGEIKNLLPIIKKGKNAMPAKGNCFDCTDEDYINLIKYMMSGK